MDQGVQAAFGSGLTFPVGAERAMIGDVWIHEPPMPTARDALAADASSGLRYAAGGITAANMLRGAGGLRRRHRWLERPRADAPAPVFAGGVGPDQPAPLHHGRRRGAGHRTARAYPAVSALGGKLYLAGGRDTAGNIVDTVEVYDPASNRWSSRAPLITRRYGATARELGGKLYVASGFDGNRLASTSSVEVHDPASNQWTNAVGWLPTARHFAGSGVIRGRLFVVGGRAGPGPALAVSQAYTP